MLLIVILFFCFISGFNTLEFEGVEVVDLPGLDTPPNFKQYSGYLRASDHHYLHYWFVESQNNPETDPLILWMNGGPGCSSLDGFLSELGPFHVKPDGKTLYENPYSWNMVANVIFLEAPAGVGYSYSDNGNVTTNDDQTSFENYNAIKQFFSIFPHYKNHEFYITGESYGGIYVPTLAVRVLEGMDKAKINLKGVAIGNGMLSFPLNTNTLMEFAYYHGLIDQKTWEHIEKSCCGANCVEKCDFNSFTGQCNATLQSIQEEILENGLNMYDLYRDCSTPQSSAMNYNRFAFDIKSAFPYLRAKVEALQEFHKISSKMYYQTQSDVSGDVPCLNDTAVTMYLNQPAVRMALHIPDKVQNFSICSVDVETHYTTVYSDMYAQIRRILAAKVPIMVYNGDTDMACNFLMGQQFVESLHLPLKKKKSQWHCNHQVAGFVTSYTGIDFVTVKGTGHMVPQWKPRQALKMITTFLNKQTLN